MKGIAKNVVLRVVVSFLIFLVSVCAKAQWTYHPFAKEGKVFQSVNRKYEMKGDTIVNGNLYKRVFITENNETRYWGATRDDNMRVCTVKSGESSETLFYDFGYDSNTRFVIDYGKVEAWMNTGYGKTNSGEIYKIAMGTWFLKNSEYATGEGLIWIDGFGNVSEPFNPTVNFANFDCYEDGICVLNMDILWQEILMNITSLNDIRGFVSQVDSLIYDLQGRRLSGKPAKGMYIQGGKKFVVK